MYMAKRTSEFGKHSESAPQLHPVYNEYREITQYWMLHLLVSLGIHKKMIVEHYCNENDVLHELGLKII